MVSLTVEKVHRIRIGLHIIVGNGISRSHEEFPLPFFSGRINRTRFTTGIEIYTCTLRFASRQHNGTASLHIFTV